jgi:hypothetical protein
MSTSLSEREDEQRVAAGDGDVLHGVGEKRHRARSDRPARLELPERFSGARIERVEVCLPAIR